MASTNFLFPEGNSMVTTIIESKYLSTMSLATLFEKLQEHEMKLQRLNQNEESDKRKRGIVRKVSLSIQEGSDNEDLDDEEDDSQEIRD